MRWKAYASAPTGSCIANPAAKPAITTWKCASSLFGVTNISFEFFQLNSSSVAASLFILLLGLKDRHSQETSIRKSP